MGLRCRDYKCRKGKINDNLAKRVVRRIAGFITPSAYPCNVCGRLHWWDGGRPVTNRRGHRAFLKNGKIFYVKRSGEKYTFY